MRRFADLLEKLVLTPSRNRKLEILCNYFRDVPDPDRGLALAAITRDLEIRNIKPALIRELATERIDAELFRYSYDFVGDMAETIALVWDSNQNLDATADENLRLSTVLQTLQDTARSDAPKVMEKLLDALDPSGRYALIKLATGGLRIGVSSRLAKQALADFGQKPVNEIEELWHGLEPPYESLFAWLEGRAEKPVSAALAPFRPVMLANALEAREHDLIKPDDYLAEWKWDGIRVQVVSDGGTKRLYSRTGDDISKAFPDLIGAMDFEGTLDGELLVRDPQFEEPKIAPFSELQKRLNRKTVSAKLQQSHPAFIRAYDILFADGADQRAKQLIERRERLERFVETLEPTRFDISSLVAFNTIDDLAAARAAPPDHVIEGLMLKRRDSPYVPGRPKGPWFKWKRDPFLIDAVLMYAQRGHGKRSGFYSDFTFGVWRDEELVPVGKAYFGFTDEELKQIDKYIRENTLERFGPVRSVRANREKGLVFEVAFEGLNRSTRHKSGVAMRFPRISRLRWDKPTAEADTLENLEKLLA